MVGHRQRASRRPAVRMARGKSAGSASSIGTRTVRRMPALQGKRRKRNEIAMMAKHWRRVRRGNCGAG